MKARENRLPHPDDAVEWAAERRKSSDTGIGAAVLRDTTPQDMDGRSIEVVVSDTKSPPGQIEVHAPRVEHDRDIVPETIEDFVEAEAGRFDFDSRLGDLIENSPLRIELYLS